MFQITSVISYDADRDLFQKIRSGFHELVNGEVNNEEKSDSGKY
jgi:hypothetical protein